MELLKGRCLLNKINKLVPVEDVMKNKHIIVFYFGALWCTAPDCKLILQKLKDVHRENLKRNTGMEIIYVSSDNDQEDFDAFFKSHGSWYAVAFDDPLAQELRIYFGITNIPNLVAVRKTGEVITRAGNQELVEKGINVLVSWTD